MIDTLGSKCYRILKRTIMHMDEEGFLKDAKGILMKNGRFFCSKCFRENPRPVQPHKRHLEARIGPVEEVHHLTDVGVVITETDLGTDDSAYMCDKCGEGIRSPRKEVNHQNQSGPSKTETE